MTVASMTVRTLPMPPTPLGLPARPQPLLLAGLMLFVVLWTLAPAMTYDTAPLDVAENILWGREWQWGYYKHPPLQAWLTEIAFSLGGLTGVFLLSASCIAATLLCIYRLGSEMADADRGLLGAMLFATCYYATIPLPEFNANILQMPIWAFAGLALWRALQGGRLTWWLLLGVACASAIYTKYSAIFLFGALAGALLVHPAGWASLRRPGPYLAALTGALLCLPHFRWLVQSGFQPIHYAEIRAVETEGLARLLAPLDLTGALLAALSPSLVLLLIGGMVRPAKLPDRFLLWLALGPLGLMLLYGTLAGVDMRDMWAAPATVWMPLALVLSLKPPRRPRWLIGAWFLVVAALPIGVAVYNTVGDDLSDWPRSAWPGGEIARRLDAIWAREMGGTPTIIAGTSWLAGMLVSQHGDATSGFVDGDYRINPWITPERVRREGVLFVWTNSPRPDKAFGRPLAKGTIDFAVRDEGKSVKLRWSICKPGAKR